MVQEQIRIFLTAVMFYTRIPCPAWVDHSEEYLNKATAYFPVIGWIAGIWAAFCYGASYWIFKNKELALVISMIAGFLLTGAFHEDGFADFCDGFGGGWTKEKILEIMKDSRVGTYGVVGLVSILALKFFSLKELQPWQLVQAFILAHTLSRYTAITFVFTHTYAEGTTPKTTRSKAKPVAQQVPLEAWAVATLFAAVPWVWMCFSLSWMVLFVPIPLIFLKIYLSNYFTKWIGGYTGDCLGATQQLAEVLIYLSLLVFLPHPFSFFHPKI